jgi:hypothetical protein
MGTVKAAIWKNDSNGISRHNVTVARIYRDEEGWKTSDSFGREQLPLLAKVVDQAHSWIYANSNSDESEQ